MRDEPSAPALVDRGTFQAELDGLRVREKAHKEKATPLQLPAGAAHGRGGSTTRLIGGRGAVTLLEVFEGRRMLITCYFMWHTGHHCTANSFSLHPG